MTKSCEDYFGCFAAVRATLKVRLLFLSNEPAAVLPVFMVASLVEQAFDLFLTGPANYG